MGYGALGSKGPGASYFSAGRESTKSTKDTKRIIRFSCLSWTSLEALWHPRRMRLLPIILLFLTAPLFAAENAALKTRNLLFVTTDGLRWQEVFRGAEEQLIGKANGGVPETAVPVLREQFWADTPEERRARLLPFLWSEVAQHGQLFGNRDAGSEAGVTNGKNFSYPGYSEFLTGHADERIKSNKPIPNPNVNVLEWLQGRPGFAGKVAAINS